MRASLFSEYCLGFLVALVRILAHGFEFGDTYFVAVASMLAPTMATLSKDVSEIGSVSITLSCACARTHGIQASESVYASS
jgi:hypothetical protein